MVNKTMTFLRQCIQNVFTICMLETLTYGYGNLLEFNLRIPSLTIIYIKHALGAGERWLIGSERWLTALVEDQDLILSSHMSAYNCP